MEQLLAFAGLLAIFGGAVFLMWPSRPRRASGFHDEHNSAGNGPGYAADYPPVDNHTGSDSGAGDSGSSH